MKNKKSSGNSAVLSGKKSAQKPAAKTPGKPVVKAGRASAKSGTSISSTARLEQMLAESEKELSSLEPQIDKLEKQLDKLRELKLARQKLITLKLSIKSILANFNESEVSLSLNDFSPLEFSRSSVNFSTSKLKSDVTPTERAVIMQRSGPVYGGFGAPALPAGMAGKMFIPDLAFREVNTVLRRRDSLNYELFRAIVFNGGMATTDNIKAYLVENRIKQPASGDSFENVELTDISSRINYLVRKGVVIPDGRGQFISSLGWSEPE